MPLLSKLPFCHGPMTCGFAACYAERLGLSVTGERPPTSSAPPGRLRLPGGAEEEKMGNRGRKGGAFPRSGAAEPHGVRQSSANLDSSEMMPPATQARKLGG